MESTDTAIYAVLALMAGIGFVGYIYSKMTHPWFQPEPGTAL